MLEEAPFMGLFHFCPQSCDCDGYLDTIGWNNLVKVGYNAYREKIWELLIHSLWVHDIGFIGRVAVYLV